MKEVTQVEKEGGTTEVGERRDRKGKTGCGGRKPRRVNLHVSLCEDQENGWERMERDA